MIRPLRRPLIVLSPKSLLRHRDAVSSLEDLTEGEFSPVIDDSSKKQCFDQVTRLVLCSGKVYFDLLEAGKEAALNHVAIIRIEQLYPFPEQLLEQIVGLYPNVIAVVWCQEEPMNQGAWYSSQHHMRRVIHRLHPDMNLDYAGRAGSAAAAAGYMSIHLQQQKQLLQTALYGSSQNKDP
jgi:2-oxoglutarate dehydrogenase E1 component